MNKKQGIIAVILFALISVIIFLFLSDYIFSTKNQDKHTSVVSHKNTQNVKELEEKLDQNSSNKLLEKSNEEQSNSFETNKNEKLVLSVNTQLQEVWYYCAPTTVSMILDSRGIQVDQYKLAEQMGTYEAFGTHNKDAIRILNKHLFGYEYPVNGQSGYRLETVTSVEKDLPNFQERVIKNIKDGYPMYYTLDISKVYPGKKGEHNVIGIGYKLADNGKDIEELYYIDPLPSVKELTGTSIQTITPRKLLEATILCVEPNYGW